MNTSYKSEKKLLFAIRYLPLLFIVILSILVTSVIELSNKNLTQETIKKTSDLYVKFHNDDIKEEVQKVYEYIKHEKENSESRLKESIKSRVYEAHAIATRIYETNKNTKSKEEIFELIKTALGSIIYNNGRGYFFIDSAKGIGLLQPLNKSLEGVNKLEFKDAKGYQFVKTIVKTIENKSERYDTYYWYKAGDSIKSYPKISFYKYFEPYDVIIGTGDYLDDYEKDLKKRIIKRIESIKLKEDSYIFLIDYEGKPLAHFDIKDKVNFFDSKEENNFLKQMIDIVKEKNEGFISYWFGEDKFNEYKKTSFVKGFEQWQWIIGTGYKDNKLKEIINEEKRKLKEVYSKDYQSILLISTISTIVLLFLSFIISKMLEKRFLEYQEKIKMEEMEFKNLFENSDVGLAINDVNGKFTKVNKQLVNMFGYGDAKEFIGKTWKDISSDEFLEHKEIFKDLKDKKLDKYVAEKVYLKADGSVFDAYLSIKTFEVAGKPKYIVSSLVDITDIKMKDNLLSQQAKMAAMGEMLANIAHQWRQPLSTISTAASGIKMNKEFDILTDECLDEFLDTITASSQYLSHTIEDFSDFFNPKKEKVYMKIEETINQAIKLTSSHYKDKNITIIRDIEDVEILSYKNELIQVIINILNNARDILSYKDYDKYIFISAYTKNDTLIICIKDNAGGIKEEIKNRIFEPYFTTKHKSQGTGIGLYMVDEIVKKHMNGYIKVTNKNFEYENKKYKGAQFKIYIPLNIKETK